MIGKITTGCNVAGAVGVVRPADVVGMVGEVVEVMGEVIELAAEGVDTVSEGVRGA